MADVIVSSIFIRLRHPQHEVGQTNQFDAQTQEWFVDADGKACPLPEKGPFTPQQLEAKGLTLPVIMSQAVQTAVRDRVDALAQATGANEERDQARAERQEAIAARDAALARVAELEAQLEASMGQTVAAIGQRDKAYELRNQMANERDEAMADSERLQAEAAENAGAKEVEPSEA